SRPRCPTPTTPHRDLPPFPTRRSSDLTRDQIKFFEEKVRPILAENCYKCHGSEKQKGNLRLDVREAVFAGGESGPVIVPGKPDRSEEHTSELQSRFDLVCRLLLEKKKQ